MTLDPPSENVRTALTLQKRGYLMHLTMKRSTQLIVRLAS